ncbi:four-carbon acid sugar kinase family protein [Oceanobacillus timonensis]|uniref:four-carbon acid sugar kinase family protein n=1 Tax=Oceanobacillus timonensis TaxID=1926285 RepID=UPI001FE8506E|nr:four-carbon acid sugar kinase family protein [Oceanobacillus timonensis]
MKQIAIIADDLTGANDSGIQLTEKGINTSVLFEIPEQTNLLSEGIVIDTNSRALSNEQAVSATRKSTNFIKRLHYNHVYKKMDSTLRGHIGQELKAMGNILDPDFLVIAPAFPGMGRTTKQGYHYVHGQLIAETEIAKDPTHPVTDSYLPALIEQQTGEKVGLLTQEDLQCHDDSFQNKLAAWKAEEIRMVCCDAETEQDLKTLAQKFSKVTNQIIWAGSAGLAEVLPQVLEIEKKKQPTSYSGSSAAMTVCGSLSEKTQTQIHYTLQQKDVEGVELNPLQMFEDQWEIKKSEYIQTCIEIVNRQKDVVLYVPSNENVRREVKELATEKGFSNNEIGETISDRMAELVVDVKDQLPRLDRFVLTGGDTAKSITQRMGAIGMHLIKQLEPGIPLVSLIGKDKSLVVTKAGAFGKESSIYHAMLELKGEKVYE